MAHRNKNLLEAFTASAASDKAAEAHTARNPAASNAGGPFASPPKQESILTPAERELVKEASSGPPAFARSLLRPENYQGLIAVIVIIAALSFLIGRATSGGVTAAEAEESAPIAKEQPGGGTELAAVPIPLPGATPARAPTSAEADLAETEEALKLDVIRARLMDKANVYTVKLVEYKRNRDEHLANPTFYYLIDQGLPAAMLFRGESLVIVLGAEPRQVDLDALVKQAKSMRGPPPNNRKAEFSDAYVEKIDNFLDRD